MKLNLHQVIPVHSKKIKENPEKNINLMRITRKILRDQDPVPLNLSKKKKFISPPLPLRGKTIENCEKVDVTTLYSGFYKYNTTIHKMLNDYKISREKDKKTKTKLSCTDNVLEVKSSRMNPAERSIETDFNSSSR